MTSSEKPYKKKNSELAFKKLKCIELDLVCLLILLEEFSVLDGGSVHREARDDSLGFFTGEWDACARNRVDSQLN